MQTLEQSLAELDAQIQHIRTLRDATQDAAEKAKYQHMITLNEGARVALKQDYAARAARQEAEEKRYQAAQQARADQQEAADRQSLRVRWSGDDGSFEEAYPDLLKQLRIDRALGRDTQRVLVQQVEF